MRGVLLPALLEHEMVTRPELKEEFVKAEQSDDVSQAGRFMSLISAQIGMEKNSFLRQVIGYEYPNYPWEKDNYHVRDGYRDLVREVLERLGEAKVATGKQAAS